MQTSGANSEHEHFEIERFSTLNEWIITQNSKDSIIVNCQSAEWPALISHHSSILGVDTHLQMQHKQTEQEGQLSQRDNGGQIESRI